MVLNDLKFLCLSVLVVWLRFILICLNDLTYISTCLGFDGFWLCFGQQRMVHKTLDDGEEQNCYQDYKTYPLLTTSKSCHKQGSPRSEENLYIRYWRSSWILTEILKTRTNVSAFKPSWTYVCDGRHLRCSKQRQAQALSR